MKQRLQTTPRSSDCRRGIVDGLRLDNLSRSILEYGIETVIQLLRSGLVNLIIAEQIFLTRSVRINFIDDSKLILAHRRLVEQFVLENILFNISTPRHNKVSTFLLNPEKVQLYTAR